MSIIGNFIGLKAYYHHSKGDKDKALELYSRAESKNMSKANYRLAYGVLLLRTGNYDKSQAVLTKLLEADSLTPRVKYYAKMNLALTYWKQGDAVLAAKIMEEVHKNLKNTSSYQTYGFLLIEAGDLQKALEFNLSALDYDNNDSVILDNVGQNYYRMGNIEEALKYFLKAEELKSDQSDTLYYLGCIYMEQGQYSLAEEKLNKAIENNTNSLCTVSNKQIEDKLAELQNKKRNA